MAFTSAEIQQKYNKFAWKYDLIDAIPEFLGFRKLRKRLLKKASGKVLEVAVGTGKNLKYYPKNCDITAVDLSKGMLKYAKNKARKLSLKVKFEIMEAETLNFPKNSFNTVVSTLASCTFPNPEKAFREMSRVCMKSGKILLLEHGRSSVQWLGRFQNKRAEKYAKILACQWNREPMEIAKRSGLIILKNKRDFFGIFHTIIAKPKK